jgi:hypothetical protein
MLDVCHFSIFTDHKSVTYAFQQKRDKCSPRQFTANIRHISGQDNVAGALSGIKSVTVPPSYNVLATLQDSDDKLQTLLGSTTAMLLKKLLPVPDTTVSISLLGDLGFTFQLLYGSKCSNLSTICCTQAPHAGKLSVPG